MAHSRKPLALGIPLELEKAKPRAQPSPMTKVTQGGKLNPDKSVEGEFGKLFDPGIDMMGSRSRGTSKAVSSVNTRRGGNNRSKASGRGT